MPHPLLRKDNQIIDSSYHSLSQNAYGEQNNAAPNCEEEYYLVSLQLFIGKVVDNFSMVLQDVACSLFDLFAIKGIELFLLIRLYGWEAFRFIDQGQNLIAGVFELFQ